VTWRTVAFSTGLWALGGAALALDPSRALDQYSMDAWRTPEGLPQNTVLALRQTRDGYLWIGTEEGLARFDGLTFTTFDTSNAPLPRNYIQSLYQARDGALWIGTYHGGVTRVAGGQFHTYTTRDGLAANGGSALAEAPDGSLWFGTLESGLCRLRDGRCTVYRQADGLPDDRVRALLQARDGTLWIGTDGGLARLRAGRFTPILERDGVPSARVLALAEDGAGAIWVGTSVGLLRMHDGNVTVHVKPDLPNVSVRALHVDGAGTLWIGTEGGLSRYRGGRFDSVAEGERLGRTAVTAIASDHEGSLWVGTEGEGLNLLKDGKVAIFGSADPRWRPSITAVTGDGDGGLWLGASGGQVSRFQQGLVRILPSEEPLGRSQVRALQQDAEGLWIGTDQGLHLYRGGLFRSFSARDGLPAAPVRAIRRDRHGTLWIGTDGGGVARRIGGRFVLSRERDGLAGDSVRFIHEDGKGRLWIGTYSGLSLFEDGRFTSYGAAEGLTDLLLRSIYEDAAGVLWLGTYGGGLFRFADGRFASISSRDGLPSDIIYGISEDRTGNLWMSCNKGIFRVGRKELEDHAAGNVHKVQATMFGVDESLKGNECNGGNPAIWRMEDGTLWFPTTNGLVRVDPANLPRNGVAPPVVIEGLFADGHRVGTANGARLAPGRHRLEIPFAGLSFLSPRRVRMAFKLEGFDADWVDAGTQRTASYTNLPPGGYTFRVKATNADGVANEEGASLAVYQEPRFHETSLFWLASGAVILVLTFAAYRVRIAQLRGAEELLKRKITEALANVKVLSGLLPVCASCKKIRDDKGYWNQIETYVRDHSEADFSHGMCPDCMKRLYPAYAERVAPKPTSAS
jgi:ligand-binding sensor domain-containing protein